MSRKFPMGLLKPPSQILIIKFINLHLFPSKLISILSIYFLAILRYILCIFLFKYLKYPLFNCLTIFTCWVIFSLTLLKLCVISKGPFLSKSNKSSQYLLILSAVWMLFSNSISISKFYCFYTTISHYIDPGKGTFSVTIYQ